ncbi:TPA: fimbrial protein [Enterobacter cancerogenus]|nr:fimbrial protein [Enterobacter cancerogenus]
MLFKNIVFVIFLLSASPIYAATCWITGGTQTITINFGPVSVQRDLPIGAVLASKSFGTQVNNTANCDYTGPYWLSYAMTYNGGVSKGDNVYSTNVEGVGIRITNGTYFSNPPATKYILNVAGLSSFPVSVDLVKTGDIKTGTLTTGNVGSYYIADYYSYAKLATMTNVIMSSGNSITPLACSISSGSLSYNMGNVSVNDFSDTTGFSPDKVVTQDIELNCDANANVNLTLDGTQNVDSTDPSILSLSNQGQQGVAQGVGVQLLYNNVPLKINNVLKLKTSSGGLESFPITARYIQTKNKVAAGTANATATLNITYQ